MNQVNLAQQEQLQKIGQYLQRIREEQGQSIDEVANQIFIRPALVRAIETADWEALPEPVFVQGFIRRYADYLGLDGRAISSEFEPTPVSVLPDPKLANDAGVDGIVHQQDRHGLKVLSKADVPPPSRIPREATPKLGWWLGLLAIAALIGGGIWLASRTLSQPSTRSNPNETGSPTEEPAALTDTETPAETETPASAPLAETDAVTEEEATLEAPIVFQVSLEGDSWMRVTADGEEVYEGILTRGTQQSWTAQEELRVTAGNSGAVQYSFNGADPVPLGNPGAVSNLTLTPETDSQPLPSQ